MKSIVNSFELKNLFLKFYKKFINLKINYYYTYFAKIIALNLKQLYDKILYKAKKRIKIKIKQHFQPKHHLILFFSSQTLKMSIFYF